MTRILVLACVVGVAVAAGVAAIAVIGGDREEIALRTSMIFSSEDGDPIDVYFAREARTRGCMNAGSFFYGSTVSCFELDRPTGSYQVIPPSRSTKSPLVVGLMPPGATGASVDVRGETVAATTRGRWILASLAPGTLGPGNRTPVDVEFDG